MKRFRNRRSSRSRIPPVALALTSALTVALTGYAAGGVISDEDIARNFPAGEWSFRSVPDGTYEGSASVGVPAGTVVAFRSFTVSVRVSDGAVIDVKIAKPAELDEDEKMERLERRVIAENGLDVDVVSGATYSGMAYLAAIRKAAFK